MGYTKTIAIYGEPITVKPIEIVLIYPSCTTSPECQTIAVGFASTISTLW
jgi:hypothetical protein